MAVFPFVRMSSRPNSAIQGQYAAPDNLAARIDLHQRFSTNPYGWMRWVFDQFTFPANGRVLELGCGSGAVWRGKDVGVAPPTPLTLSDASAGMLRAAKRSLSPLSNTVRFAVLDARSIPFPDRSFDVVIANHMLYHVDSPADAIREVWRVLRPDGVVYATTNGIGHLKEIAELLHEFDALIACPLSESARRFGLENGPEQLGECFDDVTIRRYQDSLLVTEPKPLVDYILSLQGVGNVTERLSGPRERQLAEHLAERIARHGPIIVTKDPGMLVARE
jgi:ubiquinone/menaquinone biosynthesis C-methylase UbiE